MWIVYDWWDQREYNYVYEALLIYNNNLSLQGFVMLSYQLNSTLSVSVEDSPPGQYNVHYLQNMVFPNVYLFLNTMTIILALPLVNHILVPCVPSMTIRERIGIGMTIHFVALGCAAYLEWAVADATPLHQALWFILPAVLLSVQETFTDVSSKTAALINYVVVIKLHVLMINYFFSYIQHWNSSMRSHQRA